MNQNKTLHPRKSLLLNHDLSLRDLLPSRFKDDDSKGSDFVKTKESD